MRRYPGEVIEHFLYKNKRSQSAVSSTFYSFGQLQLFELKNPFEMQPTFMGLSAITKFSFLCDRVLYQ